VAAVSPRVETISSGLDQYGWPRSVERSNGRTAPRDLTPSVQLDVPCSTVSRRSTSFCQSRGQRSRLFVGPPALLRGYFMIVRVVRVASPRVRVARPAPAPGTGHRAPGTGHRAPGRTVTRPRAGQVGPVGGSRSFPATGWFCRRAVVGRNACRETSAAAFIPVLRGVCAFDRFRDHPGPQLGGSVHGYVVPRRAGIRLRGCRAGGLPVVVGVGRRLGVSTHGPAAFTGPAGHARRASLRAVRQR
jgi:hypothetical protein